MRKYAGAVAVALIMGLLGLTAPAQAQPAHPGLGTGALKVAADAAGGTWRTAEEIPGSAALNKGGFAEVNSMSCASPGNCSAVGDYQDRSHHTQAFAVSETKGHWGTAEEVPGTAALNKGGNARISSVSCASPGNCSAGGFYISNCIGGPCHSQAFVVTEKDGTWGTAEQVRGTASKLGQAATDSVSCASAGNCSASGYYTDSSGRQQAFVTNETHGAWGTAEQVPGTAALNDDGLAEATSVSCASPGNCSAGGNYASTPHRQQVFVVNETTGT
jgi:hypothetical protein